MSPPRDYYQVLGVRRNASADEIRQAYRRLAREFHPDVNKAENAQERFSEVSEAHEVLGDEEKRRDYDRFGHAGRAQRAHGGPAPGGWPGGGGAPVGGVDIGAAFEELFRGAGAGGSPFGRQAPPRPSAAPPPLRHTVTVSFLTAAQGGTERVRMTGGDGSDRSIDVKIPAGIEPGSKLRVKGAGAGAGEDLIITVETGAHPYFRRDGLDLLVEVPLTIAEAALGTSVTVPLLEGSVDMKIPPGAASGRKLRVRGKGIESSSGKTGDFYAVIQIVAPTTLSETGRELLERLGPELQNPRDSGPWADS